MSITETLPIVEETLNLHRQQSLDNATVEGDEDNDKRGKKNSDDDSIPNRRSQSLQIFQSSERMNSNVFQSKLA